MPPASTHSPLSRTRSWTRAAIGARTIRCSRSQRAWARLASRIATSDAAAAIWSSRAGSRAVARSASMAATCARPSSAADAGLVEARLGGEIAAGEAGLPLQVLLGVGQRRLGLGEVRLQPGDLLRPLAELEVGELRAGAGELRLGLGHGRALAPVLQLEQQRPGLDPVAALHRHGLQPAGGGRPQPDVLALGVAVQPACSSPPIAAGEQEDEPQAREQPVHGAPSPAAGCRHGRRAPAPDRTARPRSGANTARQTAIISTGATTRRATASLSCGRNSPAATPRRCSRGDQGQAPVGDGRPCRTGRARETCAARRSAGAAARRAGRRG